MKKILNYGSLNLDYVYQVEHFVAAGETLSSDRLDVNCGGKGLNQSIAAAKAGARVYHAGKIGREGARLRAMLEENGVDTSFLREGESQNGHAIIQVNAQGQNCILLFPGSNHQIAEREVDDCFAAFDAGDYLILQNEINLIPYLMRAAAEKGMKIIFNPSPITPELAEYPLELVSLLVLNEVEGKALGGTEEPDGILRALREKYPRTDVLLSLGKDGAIFFDGEQKLRHGIYRAPVVDTTAAGDTLMGYFTAGLAAGLPPEEALRRASVASSITVSRAGAAASIPTPDEVERCGFEYLG